MATTVANPEDVTTATPVALETSPNSELSDSVKVDNQAIQTQQITPVNAGLSGILSQPAVKRAMPGIIVFLTVGLFLLAYSWLQEPPYKSVYSEMSQSDINQAYQALNGAGYDPKIDQSSGELKVPSKKYYEAIYFLAAQGLPQEAGGMANFNDDDSMTTSQFRERKQYLFALEKELETTIKQINSIKQARVHLAAANESPFARNRTPAKATVQVTTFPGRAVSTSQVQAIVHMVASSIPFLSSDDVSVIDQRGELLTDSSKFSSMQLSSEQMAHKQQMEEYYKNRIDLFLGGVVGIENVRSEVDIQLDFTETESTYEAYDPDDNGPLTRSEILNIEEETRDSKAIGVPGAQSNTSPGSPNGGGVPDPDMKSRNNQTTRNYELDREIRYKRNKGATIEKISVAVVINGVLKSDPDDEEDLGYSQQELDGFADLIKGAIGFQEARGDSVQILATAFNQPEFAEEKIIPWYANEQILNVIKIVLGSLIAIIFIFFVVRPVLKTYIGPVSISGGAAGKDGELTAAELNMLSSGDGGSIKDIRAKLKPKKSGLSAEMLDTANTYDDKVALVRLLVAEDAGRVANVLKKMIKPA